MRPFDPRLARDVQPVKGSIGITAILHLCATVLFIAQSIVLARVISEIFLSHASLNSQLASIELGAAAWCGRTLLININEWQSRKSALSAVGVTRRIALEKLAAMSPRQIGMPQGAMVSLLTRGIDGLEVYVSKYLPQLVVSAFVPMILGAVILWLDPISAAIIVVTIPLIPIFMALVGWFTQSSVQQHWTEVNRLAGTLSDLMRGLPELKVFGRARGLAQEIRLLGEQQKEATLKVLRLSFLSAFVLELLATISVALIAVGIGVRLVNGEMELWRGLAALVIAPEVYAPLRMLGVHFHAAAEGLEAWNQVRRILDVEIKERGTAVLHGPVSAAWSNVEVQFGDTHLRIPDGHVSPGSITVLAGPSGCGKSSMLSVLLGTLTHYTGLVSIQTEERAVAPIEIAATQLPRVFGFVGQNAWIGEGTLQSIVGTQHENLVQRLQLTLPADTYISDRDQGVSVGQRRRIAVAGEIARKPKLLILDEPAAALDEESEKALLETLRWYADSGHAVLVVAHRQSMIDSADVLVSFEAART